jgi:PAP2 superfamily
MRTRPAALFLIPSPTSADVGRPATSRRPSASGRAGTRAASLARFAALELAIWAAVYGTYLVVRGLTIGAPAAAFDHAWEVVDLERALGIFHEPAVQQLLGPLAAVFAFYYMVGFGPLLGLVIVWLGLRHPESYRGLRNALLLSIALATVVFVAFSTAPPRLVGGLGIEDTVGLSSHDTGSFLGIRFNPYAAVPSMHVGWALLVGIFGFRAARARPLRVFFCLHPALMAMAVTATGNHFFLDAAGGVAVACLALALLQAGGRLPALRLPELVPRPHAPPARRPGRRAAAA